MTDKQIIVDDVDVSKCCYFENNKCLWQKRYCESANCPECEKIDNCYYKQLKRLENEYEGFAVKYTDMEIALHNKERECERLKEHFETAVELFNQAQTAYLCGEEICYLDLEEEFYRYIHECEE